MADWYQDRCVEVSEKIIVMIKTSNAQFIGKEEVNETNLGLAQHNVDEIVRKLILHDVIRAFGPRHYCVGDKFNLHVGKFHLLFEPQSLKSISAALTTPSTSNTTTSVPKARSRRKRIWIIIGSIVVILTLVVLLFDIAAYLIRVWAWLFPPEAVA